jgi:hypothetical protein
VVAGFATWFDAAKLFLFKKIYEGRDGRFFDSKLLFAGMRVGAVDSGEPGRVGYLSGAV